MSKLPNESKRPNKLTVSAPPLIFTEEEDRQLRQYVKDDQMVKAQRLILNRLKQWKKEWNDDRK